jgi:hypothetical protein
MNALLCGKKEAFNDSAFSALCIKIELVEIKLLWHDEKVRWAR